MNALIAPKGFIAKGRMHKVLTIILHTIQVTQAKKILKVSPKIVFNIVGDHLTPIMAIIFFVHALHF
jgi:hypothetical protein